MKRVVMLIRTVDWLFITSERGLPLILLFCWGWGLGFIFDKGGNVRATEAICSKINFSRVSFQK